MMDSFNASKLAVKLTACALLVWSAPALAQPAPQQPPPPDPNAGGGAPADAPDGPEPARAAGEVIIVTGSRIRTDPLDAPAPVLQVSSEDIQRSGVTSVADLLQRLPVSGGALNTKFNSSGNFGFPPDGGGIGAGGAEADLRYLGSKRVLVLVDGVRWINGSSASGVPSATDLNTIPIGIIDRIEVLEDGASALYGSDAIGGVINIITKKNWRGVSANVYTGSYHQGDGVTQQYDVSFGGKDDRLSYVFNVSYVDQGRVSAADRELSKFPIPNAGACTPQCSSGTPQGRFVLTDPNTGQPLDLTIDDLVGGVPIYDPADPGGAGDDFHPFATEDRFNFAPFNLVLTPSRRIGAFSGIEYELTDHVRAYGRALFNNRVSVNQAAPEPIFIGPEAGNGNRLDRISIHVTNPYNPFGFTIDAATNPYFIGRRPLEGGPRIFEQTVNTLYLSGGLRGDFEVGGSRFYWDSAVAFGTNRADQIKQGGYNAAKLEKALGPAFFDDETQRFRCGTSRTSPDFDPECVPFNIFGGQGANGAGTISQEMLDYVGFVQKDVSEQQLIDVTANVGGDLVELPGGWLSVAAGVEYRDQSGFFQPDPVVVAGDSAGVPSSPTSGSFDVREGYLELRVPIASDRPGADLLDLLAAARVSDYSTFGAQVTGKVGARWRPVKDLLLRGSFGQGFRAPGIGELFGSEARFDRNLSDPCSDMLGNFGGDPQPQNVVDSCVALGVPADGSYQQFNSQISVTTGGNRALQPETADSITASLAYSPSAVERSPAVDNLDFELTYYRITLDSAIQAIDAQVQLDSCINTLDPTLCGGISRTPGGVINGFANQLTNIGGIRTSGLDLKIDYLAPAMPSGRFRATLLSSFLFDFTELIPDATEPDGFQRVTRDGFEVGDPEQAFPKFKSTLIVDWFRGEWRASFVTRYIHSVTETCTDLGDLQSLCSDPEGEQNVLSPTVYNDAQVTWTPEKLERKFDLTIGANNLFNREPPACYSCALNGFDATTYDIPGLFAYLRAGYRI